MVSSVSVCSIWFRRGMTVLFMQGMKAVLWVLAVSIPCVQAEDLAGANDAKIANKIFFEAQKQRLAWIDFPGFTSNIEIQTDDALHQGKIVVQSDFTYELAIHQDALQPWVEDKLRSVIGHRKPSGDEAAEVKFAENPGKPETGFHLVSVEGGVRYLILDGKIAEIRRKSAKNWLEITNVRQIQFADGGLLPEFTTVTYRDPSSGAIHRSVANDFQWTKVENFQLPSFAYAVETSSDGKRQVRKMRFTNHLLTSK